MEHGKKICKALKNIRSLVAQANDIPLQIEECTYEGHCTGTCPKCEAEARFLEEALQQRRDKGLPIRVEHLMSEEHLRQIVESSSDDNNFDNEDFTPLQGEPMPPKYMKNEQLEKKDDDIHVLEGIEVPEMGQVPDNVYKKKKRMLYMECKIAGTTFHDLTDVWDELYEGADLALVRQKDNKYDKNAVAVALAGDYDGDPDDFDFEHILGYVPRTDNELLARMLDSGWSEAFECELSRVNGTEPDKGSLYMNIYVVSKDTKGNGSLRIFELDDEDYEEFKSNMESQGCSYFRLGGFHPWEHNFPKKGEKVVFMYRGKEYTKLYLMHCIAVGDDDASYFVKDKKMLHALDDCCFYVFTNTKGPVNVPNDELKFLSNEKYDIEMFQSNEISYRLRKIFEDDKA